MDTRLNKNEKNKPCIFALQTPHGSHNLRCVQRYEPNIGAGILSIYSTSGTERIIQTGEIHIPEAASSSERKEPHFRSPFSGLRSPFSFQCCSQWSCRILQCVQLHAGISPAGSFTAFNYTQAEALPVPSLRSGGHKLFPLTLKSIPLSFKTNPYLSKKNLHIPTY